MKFFKSLAYLTLAAASVAMAIVAVPVVGVLATITTVGVLSITGAACIEGISSIPDKRIVAQDTKNEVDSKQILAKTLSAMVVTTGLSHVWFTIVAELTTGLITVVAAPAWVSLAMTVVVTGAILGSVTYMVHHIFINDKRV